MQSLCAEQANALGTAKRSVLGDASVSIGTDVQRTEVRLSRFRNRENRRPFISAILIMEG
jgi:hypothetical protein